MTTPSAKGFGLGEFHQASLAAKSLMAQFEYLCIKYKSTCLKKIGVSYTKLLLVPFAILKFGWTDELSIDCRMKGIWSKVGAAGGAGCSAVSCNEMGADKRVYQRPLIKGSLQWGVFLCIEE